MPGFKSDHFSTNQPGQNLKTFTVGEPEDVSTQPSIQEAENLARAARQQRIDTANRIGEVAKKRIELLANIGRLNKDVKIGEYIFSLRTLKARETHDASTDSFKLSLTNIELSFEARRQQLARSIHKIDGNDIKDIIGSDELSMKIAFINELEENVVRKLWDEFSLLNKEAREKYGINTAEDAKEVANDLKK